MRVRLAMALVAVGVACGGAPPAPPASERGAAARNQADAAACERGDGDACGLLGMSLLLEARAYGRSTEAALSPFEAACDRDAWLGCAMASSVQASLGRDSSKAATRAFTLATASCGTGGSSACAFLGDWAVRAGQTPVAALRYRDACVDEVGSIGERALDEYSCVKAIELGADLDELRAVIGETDLHPEFQRIFGHTQIQPPRIEHREACKRGIDRLTARLTLCVSDAGVPTRIHITQHSGARHWERRLFETMRTWRYRPPIEDGVPVAVCTGVTFFYAPTCRRR